MPAAHGGRQEGTRRAADAPGTEAGSARATTDSSQRPAAWCGAGDAGGPRGGQRVQGAQGAAEPSQRLSCALVPAETELGVHDLPRGTRSGARPGLHGMTPAPGLAVPRFGTPLSARREHQHVFSNVICHFRVRDI